MEAQGPVVNKGKEVVPSGAEPGCGLGARRSLIPSRREPGFQPVPASLLSGNLRQLLHGDRFVTRLLSSDLSTLSFSRVSSQPRAPLQPCGCALGEHLEDKITSWRTGSASTIGRPSRPGMGGHAARDPMLLLPAKAGLKPYSGRSEVTGLREVVFGHCQAPAEGARRGSEETAALS